MGTNYYCREKTKDLRERHIGKKSSGWAFLFHGYEKSEYALKDDLKNYASWKKYLLDDDVEVYDESGVKIHTVEFLDMIEASLTETKHSANPNEGSWHDDDGYTFVNHYFC